MLTQKLGPALYYNPVFAGFTMQVMNDVGYYKPNPEMEEYLAWGKGKECDAFSGSCVIHPHRCRENTRICSPDFKSMGSCTKDDFVEQCSVFKPEKYQDCYYSENKARLVASGAVTASESMSFGLESRCMMGIIDDAQKELVKCNGLGCNALPACMKMVCDYGTDSRLLGITIDLPEGAVDADGATISTMKCPRRENNAYKPFTIKKDGQADSVGTFLICPNPDEMCDPQLFCPSSCNLNGRCLKSGKCWCYYGWKGLSCDQRVPEAELSQQYTILNAAVFGSWLLKLSCISILLAMLNLELF